MKKTITIGCTLCAMLLMMSCKAKESQYKAAYERAQQTQMTEPIAQVATPTVSEAATPVQQVTPVEPVTPVTPVTPATPVTPLTPATPVASTDPTSVPVRVEAVTLVNGSGLQAYNVVCGSFGVQANAERLQETLKSAGYPALIAVNPATNMYRVIATSHGDKAAAVKSRDALRSLYPDAWLLLNQ